MSQHPATASDEKSRVVLALVAVQVFFGVHYLAAKIILAEISPAAYTVLRIWGGTLFLAVLVLLMRRRFPKSPSILGQLALFSFFGIILNQLLFAEGLKRTTPIHSSLINTTIPLMTLLFAVLLSRELATRRRILALAIGLLGALLVIRPDPSALAGASLTGDLLTLANGTSFSFFLVISRPLMQKIDPLPATVLLLMFGAVGVSLVGLDDVLRLDLLALSPRIWALIVFAMIFPTAGAYVLQYWALARADSSFVALFIYLQPVIAAGLSIVFLNDVLTLSVISGAALIFAAVFMARTRARPKLTPTQRVTLPVDSKN